MRQAFAADIVDDLYLGVIPVALGSGQTNFDAVHPSAFTQLDFTHSTSDVHIHYRVK